MGPRPRGREHGRNGDGDVNLRAGFRFSNGVKRVDPFTCAVAFKDLDLFIQTICGDEEGCRLPDNFFGGGRK